MCWFMLAMENNKTNAILEQVVCSSNVFTVSKHSEWELSAAPRLSGMSYQRWAESGWFIEDSATCHCALHTFWTSKNVISEQCEHISGKKVWFSSQRHHNQTPTVLKNKLKLINKMCSNWSSCNAVSSAFCCFSLNNRLLYINRLKMYSKLHSRW